MLQRARALLRTGLTAGSGYAEVWIRDLNTFLAIALEVNEHSRPRDALLTFFKFQGPEGDIVDGYIPVANANVAYQYRKYHLALDHFLEWIEPSTPRADHWRQVRDGIRRNVRQHLWDVERQKFIPHIYLAGSPFPSDFDESLIWYHGGTAVAIEAGLLSPDEIRASLDAMRANVRKAGASSIGLTVYPPYPEGFFLNPSMAPWSYQNGGDWCWFGGRMIQQLIRHGLVADAYEELKPMVSRVLKNDGFFEWWTRDNQPRGSGQFRGSAGVLGRAIQMLQAWAEEARTTVTR